MKDFIKKYKLILIVVLILIDQFLKIFIFTTDFKMVTASGAGLILEQKIVSENNLAYILIDILAIIILIKYMRSKNPFIKDSNRVILSFGIAGAISNLIDRIWNGKVINYINIPNFATINLAYIYIIITWIGVAILLTKYTTERIQENKKKKTESSPKKERER